MLTSLPLFPLNAALVPGLVLPLHIFEPRYRRMIEELLARPEESDREFGMIAVREGHQVESGGITALHEVGTTAIVRGAKEYEDGRFDIVTTGNRRFRLRALTLPAGDPTATFMEAEVEFLDEPAGDPAPELAAQVSRLFARYRGLLGQQVLSDDEGFGEAFVNEATEEQSGLAYLVTASMVIPGYERQRLLAANDSHARLLEARRLLIREIGLITLLECLPAREVSGPGFCPN